jgi:MFS family permease
VTDSVALPDESSDLAGRLQLRRWSDPAIVAIAFVALASGFGQYGAVAALGDVSKQLGHVAAGGSIADKVGLSGTSLGVGLAIIRLASLGSLPLIGIADRFGRRRVILVVTILGLGLTVVAAASPGYWWFVAIFAFGRPLLSATNALAEVMGAEETGSSDRSAAVALIAAGYGVGAGLSAIVHSLAAGALGFRGIFALAVVPLVGVYAMRHRVEEPRRFMVAEAAAEHPTPVWGAVGRRYRGRVVVLAVIGFAISVVTGPANSFAFLYAQDVLHLAGYVTAIVVVVSGASGVLGLVAGRWLADRIGRRLTGTVALVGIACTGTLAYTGSESAYAAGYVLGVLSGGLLAPAIGAMLAELFPTSVRASVTGWWVTAGVLGAVSGLVAFGAVADVGNRFAAAAELTFLPAAAAAALFWFLPETKGREPEALWPDPDQE